MEDIIILILTAAVMIGSAVSSANKKKKEAARRAGQPPAEGTSAKSIGELLEELANAEEQPYLVDTESQTEFEPEYFEEEYASAEEVQSASERLEAIAYKPVERISSARIPVVEPVETTDASQTDVNDIISEFDLKRAVIEAEILKPKFEQY